jgi:hypothetical protein
MLDFMDIEHVRDAVHKQPFEAFTIRLSDGRALPVKHPEFVAISPNLVVVIGEKGYGASHIDPFLIVSVEFEGKQPQR